MPALWGGNRFWALGEVLKAHAGIQEFDQPAVAAAKLADAVAAAVPDQAERHADYLPTSLALWLGIIAVLLALGTAWAGGELVERLGVGVDEGANLDAPSSLSGPARAGRPHPTA